MLHHAGAHQQRLTALLLHVDCIPFRLGTVLAPTIAAALRKSASGTPRLSAPQQQLITDFPKVAYLECLPQAAVTLTAQVPKEETAYANL